MKKKEMRLLVERLIESGKGLALAELMEEGEPKTAAIGLFNLNKDEILKQLELLCEDCDYKRFKEVVEDGEKQN